jgi:hypothetical protein
VGGGGGSRRPMQDAQTRLFSFGPTRRIGAHAHVGARKTSPRVPPVDAPDYLAFLLARREAAPVNCRTEKIWFGGNGRVPRLPCSRVTKDSLANPMRWRRFFSPLATIAFHYIHIAELNLTNVLSLSSLNNTNVT